MRTDESGRVNEAQMGCNAHRVMLHPRLAYIFFDDCAGSYIH